MNPADEVSVKRVLNVPKRGVGDTTVGRLDVWANGHGVTFMEALRRADEAGVSGPAAAGHPPVPRPARRARATWSPDGPGRGCSQAALDRSGYLDELEAEHTVESAGRLENLGELVGSAQEFETVDAFLEQIALVADTDEIDGDDSRVMLMTLHSAKGLEFPVVFLVGVRGGRVPPPAGPHRARRAGGGAAARLRRHHPGPRAPVPQPRVEPDAVRVDAVQPARRFLDEIPERAGRAHRAGPAPSGPRVLSRRRRRPARRGSADRRRPRAHRRAGHRRRRRAARPRAPKASGLRVGDDVRHAKFGEGVIIGMEGSGDKAEAIVRFRDVGEKRLLLAWSPLERVVIAALAARLRLGLGGDATLGTVLERLAAVHGRRRLIERGRAARSSPPGRRRAGRPWAGALAARIEPGDRVVLATPNGYEQFLLCLAVSRAGGIAVPVNPQMRPDEVDHVVADPAPTWCARRPTSSRCRAAGRAVPAAPGDVAALFYTSGTTGRPKGVELTHRGLLGGLRGGPRCRPCSGRDEAVVALPVAHIMGFAVLLGLACSGMPAYFLAASARRRARRHRAAARHDLRRACRPCTACSWRRAPRSGTCRACGCGPRGPTSCPPTSPSGSSAWAPPQAALRRAHRRGGLRRGLRHGRVAGAVAVKAQPAPARPAAAG